MKELTQEEARKIHDIVMLSDDNKFIEEYKMVLGLYAEIAIRNGTLAATWNPTPLNDVIWQKLASEFTINHLCECNVVRSVFEGVPVQVIELFVLAKALPRPLLSMYLDFNPEQKLAELGVDNEEFKVGLKDAFRGTIGIPGQSNFTSSDFGILMDAEFIRNNEHILREALLLNTLLYFATESQHMHSAQEAALVQRGINPESVCIINPRLNPFTVQMIAKITNFQGASYYLPHGQSEGIQ